MSTVDGERIVEALKIVADPELQLNVVDLGLVRDVSVTDSHAHIKMMLTTIGCPYWAQIEHEVTEVVTAMDGIDTVRVEFLFTEAWSPKYMTPDGKMFAQSMGWPV